MGNKYTEAQKKASITYQRKKAQIKITTEKEQRDEIKKYAESKGVTVTEMFLDLVYKDMEKNIDNYDEILVYKDLPLDKSSMSQEVKDKLRKV